LVKGEPQDIGVVVQSLWPRLKLLKSLLQVVTTGKITGVQLRICEVPSDVFIIS